MKTKIKILSTEANQRLYLYQTGNFYKKKIDRVMTSLFGFHVCTEQFMNGERVTTNPLSFMKRMSTEFLTTKEINLEVLPFAARDVL